MDSLTHLTLGACMGEAFAGRTLGKKAMLWGALAQSIPDIDFIASGWMNSSAALLAHRGFTHSFLFTIIIAVLFALIAERWHRPHNIRLQKWLLFFGLVIFAHVFLDAFNNYGVGWFEPFSHRRISFNTIYVADPFFSIWPIIATAVLLYLPRLMPVRRKCWKIGLGISTLYLLYCIINKWNIDKDVRNILQKQEISYTRYMTTPAPLQNWLWYVVAGTDSGYYVGFRSLFDDEKTIKLQYFPRRKYLLAPVSNQEELQKLIRFSQQFYTVEKWGDTLVFNDLRFGQITGWSNPKGKFVFHYYLQQPQKNKLVIQSGRFSGWNMEVLKGFIHRIRGHNE